MTPPPSPPTASAPAAPAAPPGASPAREGCPSTMADSPAPLPRLSVVVPSSLPGLPRARALPRQRLPARPAHRRLLPLLRAPPRPQPRGPHLRARLPAPAVRLRAPPGLGGGQRARPPAPLDHGLGPLPARRRP